MPTKKYFHLALTFLFFATFSFSNDILDYNDTNQSKNNVTLQMVDQNLSFSNTYWKLITLVDNDINTENMSREVHMIFSILLERKGKFKGASGCNAMLGTYEGSDNNLSIDQKHIAMTRMACPDIKIEAQFIQVLGLTTNWNIVENHLELMDNNQTVLMRFKAVKK